MSPDPVVAALYAYFRSQGFSSAQANGILGNVKEESNFNPRAVGDSGLAHGLCQWHPDRRSAILHGCGINILTASALDQAKALVWELRHVETAALRALQRSKTAGAAGAAFCQFYERPLHLGAEMHERAATAEQLAKIYTH